MDSWVSLRAGIGRLAGPVIGVCSVIYFGFHVIHGDRGLLTYVQLKQHIAETRPVLSELRENQQRLANRVSLLRPDSLDPDMLEEQARAMLNYGYADDIIILYNTGEPEP